MNVVNVKFLLATLLSFTAGTVGCATAQTTNTPSWNSTKVLVDAGQTVMQSAAGENLGVEKVSRSASPVGPVGSNPTATSPAVQLAQTSFHQPVQPTSNKVAATPLRTFGPGDDLLDIVEQASGVVLVDFYADWCGPCRTQGGILHEMELTATQNDASIIKVNIDQHRRLASAFKVTSLPTLILIKDGMIIERQTGLANHQKVASLLSR